MVSQSGKRWEKRDYKWEGRREEKRDDKWEGRREEKGVGKWEGRREQRRDETTVITAEDEEEEKAEHDNLEVTRLDYITLPAVEVVYITLHYQQ